MARLQRASAATPNHRNTPAPTSAVTANTLQYKPPTHPLDPAAQRTLDNLQRAHTLHKLKEQYRRASELVTDSASSINERHALKLERRAREQRRKRAREAEKEKEKEKDGNGGEELRQVGTEAEADAEAEAEAAREIERLTGRVDGLTQRMDESIRRIVDGQVNVEAVEHCLRVVQNKAASAGGAAVAASQRREARSQEQQWGGRDGDEEMADVTADDSSGNNAPELYAPLEAFRQELNSANERYKALSMSARYSENNDYIGFRQSVHDARSGDEGPPLAHASTWFPAAASGGQAGHGASTVSARTTTRNGNRGDELDNNDIGVSTPSQSSSRRNGNQSATMQTALAGSNQRETNMEASDEEDDIAIARERISTRCPLTLREFDEPVTSRNCPHSFEKSAILGLIDDAPPGATRRRGAPARNLAKQVKCPVTGCYEMLRAADLHTDPVLVRKIRRIQQSRIRAASEEEEVAEQESANRNSLVIPSDLTEDIDADGRTSGVTANVKRENLKREEVGNMNGTERGTTLRESQGPMASQRSVIVDLENSTEEEDDEEDEEVDEEDEEEEGESEG